VFALSTKGNIKRVVEGEPLGTLVSETEDVRTEHAS
jgi:hypothetical protein